MNLDEILNRLAKGEITPQTAKKFIQLYSIVEIDNIAKIDSGRSTRKGIPEIILAEGKSSSDLIKISKKLFSNSGHIIISRVNNHQMKSLSKTFPKKYLRMGVSLLLCDLPRLKFPYGLKIWLRLLVEVE